MTMNQSIYEELEVISKMPGPRGYNGSRGEPGAGNLTLCEYKRFSVGSSAGSSAASSTGSSAGSTAASSAGSSTGSSTGTGLL